MASFTDEILQYNPYVQQVPTDDYVRVGLQKQEQYKEGMTKAQGYIDTISGLEIAHPEQKAYLEKRLGQMENSVSGILSGDFSKDQLVNQVGYLASKVASDPIIENAVLSTSRYKTELGKMQKAQTEGKSNAANEWDFSQQADKWLSNKDVKASFNGQYTPYTDVRKKAIEIIKDLKPDANISDSAFTYDKDGKLVLSDAILREEFKGVSPQKIQQALANAFSQDDFRQLEIEGRYSYSNKGPQDMKPIIEGKINTQLQDIAGKKQVLVNTKSGLTDVAQKNLIDIKLKNLEDQEKSLQREGDGYKKALETNPDAVRAQLYTNQFLGNIADAFSYTELSKKYENNPMAEMQLRRDQLNQQYREFKAKNEQWQADYLLKYKEYELKANKAKPGAPGGGLGGVSQTVGKNEIQDVTMQKFIEQTDGLDTQLKGNETQFLQSQGKDKAWLDQQEQLYHQGTQVSPLIENYFRNKEAVQTQASQNKQLITQLDKEADRDPSMVVGNLIPKNAPTLSVTDTKGGKTTISPQEIVAFNDKLQQIKTSSERVGGYGSVISGLDSESDAQAANILSPKEMLMYNSYKAYHNGTPMTQADRTLVDNINHYNSLVNVNQGGIVKKRLDFLNTQLATRVGETQRVAYRIPAGKAEERDEARGLIDNLLANAQTQDKSFGSATEASYKKLKKMNDDAQATYSLVVKDKTQFGDAKFWLRVNNSDADQQDIPITPEQKRQIFGDSYENQADNSGFRGIRQQILSTGKGSTNFNLGNESVAPTTAYFGKTDFPQVGKFSVKGDMIQQNGGYALRLYVYDPINKKTQSIDYAPSAGLMDEKSALAALQNMNDGSVFQLLYGKPPSPDDFRAIDEANKKPF